MTDPRDLALERILVVRCQVGDPAAFEEIVARHGPRLRYFLGKMVRARDDPEDLLQEVWLDVYRKIGALRSPAAFGGWLYRIARDRAFGALRRRSRVTREEALPPEAPAATEPDFGPADAGAIHAALDRLRPEHREVLILRFMEDMSHEEIAGVLGVPVGIVQSRLHHGKIELERAIERTRTP